MLMLNATITFELSWSLNLNLLVKNVFKKHERDKTIRNNFENF